MDSVESLRKLVTRMIKAHDEFNFEEMSALLDQSVISKEGAFFTKEKFIEVCEKLKESCGEMVSIEALGNLSKIDTIQTLWKVKYSNTEREILWQMNVVCKTGVYEIVSMSVN